MKKKEGMLSMRNCLPMVNKRLVNMLWDQPLSHCSNDLKDKEDILSDFVGNKKCQDYMMVRDWCNFLQQ